MDPGPGLAKVRSASSSCEALGGLWHLMEVCADHSLGRRRIPDLNRRPQAAIPATLHPNRVKARACRQRRHLIDHDRTGPGRGNRGTLVLEAGFWVVILFGGSKMRAWVLFCSLNPNP